jgi:probable rRNA maturation factor
MIASPTPFVAVDIYLEDEFSPQASDPDWSPDLLGDRWIPYFQRWLNDLSADLSGIVTCELSLRWTGDRQIQLLNSQYRQIDRPTDVLAFAALEADMPAAAEADAEPTYLGDIVISIETAQRQARERDHSLSVELGWLATHGLLHLLGWDHPDDASLQIMLARQETLLRLVGLIGG